MLEICFNTKAKIEWGIPKIKLLRNLRGRTWSATVQ